jgi:hypothetical protein
MATIDDSCKISLYLSKQFQKNFFLEIDRQKQELPMAQCLLADGDEMVNLYR